jgi:hypothetical protein
MKFALDGARDLIALVRSLNVGLKKLNFQENFEAIDIEGIEIPSNSEVTVRNKLTYIPTKYIITSQSGNGLITKGDTPWTRSALYFKNNGNETVTVNVTFMR